MKKLTLIMYTATLLTAGSMFTPDTAMAARGIGGCVFPAPSNARYVDRFCKAHLGNCTTDCATGRTACLTYFTERCDIGYTYFEAGSLPSRAGLELCREQAANRCQIFDDTDLLVIFP